MHAGMNQAKDGEAETEPVAGRGNRQGSEPEDSREQRDMRKHEDRHGDTVRQQRQAGEDPPFMPLHRIEFVNQHQGDRQDKKAQVEVARHFA